MALDRPGPAGHRYFLSALPFLVMAAIVAVDLLQGPSDEFLPVLSLGPALASVSRRAVPTALIGALALGVGFLLAVGGNLFNSNRGITGLITIFGVTVACVVASAIRERRERELADVKAVAEMAQQVLLRPVPGHVPPLDIAVRYISASAAAHIGGDLYEVVTTASGSATRFILGDVQGKGLPAVRTASVVLGAFREAAYDAVDLPEIAARIELSLLHQAATEEFVTAVIAQIGADSDVIEILDCGHPPPLLVRNGVISLIEDPDPGLPLGLGELTVSRRIPIRVRLAPGDQVLCYTDGISEARDKTGTFYPLPERGVLLGEGDLDDMLDRLSADVARYVGRKLDDDAAMLLIRHAPGRAAEGVPGVNAEESLLASGTRVRSDK
ncbi:MAG TPA: PP2C family protein-serine/threonine phosphatase [Trebonia sp.]|jgi:serine phosphatase RsbU (regulator of sigma subunit)|nr:PP2C family protein-serine/threonine phosphatase [Trebonia sp.]